MAKRKRLTPPNPGYLDAPPPAEPRGMFASAPIADVAREAASSAALDEMSDTLTRARAEGRMVLDLALSDIRLDYLVRDRIAADDAEMTTLKDSLRARGQQTPIEVADLGPNATGPRYGLISGWRRCQALAQLADESGEDRFGHVQALLRRPDQASDAYLAMVEENEIRVGLSYYERARIVAMATQQGVYDSEKSALAALFASGSRAKRSKIGSFLGIVAALDGALRFPEAIGERAGLVLSRALEDHPGLDTALRKALTSAKPTDPEAEAKVIEASIKTPPKPPKKTLIRSKTPPAPEPVTNIFTDPGTEPKLSDFDVRAARTGGSQVAPGVWMRVYYNGDVAISGDRVTGDLHVALRTWLAQNA